MAKISSSVEARFKGPLPTFVIAGAAKAGTTSLTDYLRQHPEIFISSVKEPHYFVDGYGLDFEHYAALFADAASYAARGEVSTGYLYSPESAAWINRALPNARIILLLRDPAERAFSLYGWMIMDGWEHAPSFEEALRLESLRKADPKFRAECPEFFPDYLYFESGLYSSQVERYLALFKDRLLILLFEDLVSDPAEVCRKCFGFLGVDSGFEPVFSIRNNTVLPRWPAAQHWLQVKLKPRVPWPAQRLADGLMALNVRDGRAPEARRETIADLRRRYRGDVLRLQETIGRDLSRWLP